MINKIDKIVIKNFESHLETEADLVPEVNIFIGPTGSGKSSLIRAIRWVMTNKPRGDSFITTGQKTCEVQLHLGDIVVTRKKDRQGLNEYTIYDKVKGKALHKFDSFGIEVPIEVLEIFGMTRKSYAGDIVSITKSGNLNFSEQMDAPFLLKDSPRTRALALGALVGAEEIDAAFKFTKQANFNTSTRLKHIEEQIVKMETELQSFEKIDSAKALSDETEILSQKQTKLEQEILIQKELLQAFIMNNKAVKKLKPHVDELKKKIDKGETIYNNFQALQKTHKETQILVQAFIKFKKEISSFRENAKAILGLILKVAERGRELKSIIEKVELNKKMQKRYTEAFEERENAVKQSKNIEEELASEQKQLEKRMEEMKVCPLSKGEFYQACKDRIANEQL